MRRAVIFTLVGVVAVRIAMGGNVYGTIRQDNRPLTGVEILLTCGGETTGGRTDNEGVYRLFVKSTGSCQLLLEPNGRKAEGSLYSYDRPTAYDFDVVQEGGRWVLRRR